METNLTTEDIKSLRNERVYNKVILMVVDSLKPGNLLSELETYENPLPKIDIVEQLKRQQPDNTIVSRFTIHPPPTKSSTITVLTTGKKPSHLEFLKEF